MYLRRLNKLNTKYHHTWIQPVGYDTKIKVYNCVTKQNVPLIFRDKNYTTWYTCGPTVYDSAHIGHASCYVKLDIIQRILKNHFNINLCTVMNITDVDDKIITRSKERKICPKELAKLYEKEFWEDLDAVHVKKPDKIVRVTENIPLILEFIEKLVENKQAYKATDGSVYFDVKAYKGVYGKLQNIGEQTHSKGVKKSVEDFALWKAAKEGEIFWESKFGKGRPGWHIECSALAGTIIGSTIDVHAGGIDLRFPHHENEEAQSCAYFGNNQWVNYWFHTGHLQLKSGQKMSKSLKNTLSIQDMLKTCKPETFRMACLMSNYRYNMEFSKELLENAESNLKNLKNFIIECKSYIKNNNYANVDSDLLLNNLKNTIESVNSALSDDFNTSACIKSLNSLISSSNKIIYSSADKKSEICFPLVAILNYVNDSLENFGLSLSSSGVNEDENVLNSIMHILLDYRQEIRAVATETNDKRLFKLCDDVREQLKNCGIELKDKGKVSSWSR